jgi:arylsulfatase A-like enzyme
MLGMLKILASALILGFLSCSQEPVATGPWRVERSWPGDGSRRRPRVSTNNRSRPGWPQGRILSYDLDPQEGAFLEWAVQSRDATAPRLLLKSATETVLVPLQRLPRPATHFTWMHFSAALEDLPAGPVELSFELEESAEQPLVSRPRLFQNRESNDRPNVVWIVLDTVRADFLGCYGFPQPSSPHMDALAARGILFERAISPAPWTLPAMVSMFTGLHLQSHGVVHTENRMPAALISLTERLADAGYTTAGFVSGTFTDSYWGLDQGFDLYDDLGMVVDDHAPATTAPTDIGAMNERAHRRVTSKEVTDKALAWLNENQDRRWFLLTHYFDPHQDFVEHEAFAGLFQATRAASKRFGANDPDPDETARLRALYAGEIAHTDQQIGRLLDQLQRLGLQENTVVVVSADHGEEFYERQWLGHGNTLFNELLWVPLIFAVPGREAARVPTCVSTVQIAATLWELCGGREPFGQGASLLPLMQASATSGPTSSLPSLAALYTSIAPANGGRGNQLGYRLDFGSHSMIRDSRTPQIPYYLFDWTEDSIQAVNLASRQREETRLLEQMYRQLQSQLGRASGQAETVEFSDEILKTLQELGYVEESEE